MNCEICNKRDIVYQVDIRRYVGQEGSKWSAKMSTSVWAKVNVCESCLPFRKVVECERQRNIESAASNLLHTLGS